MNADSSNSMENTGLPGWLNRILLSAIDLFQLYRLLLVIFLLSSYFTETGPVWLGLFSAKLFVITGFTYLALIAASLILDHLQKINQAILIQFIVITDLVCITLMMHASGGIQNGMGLLLAISVTAGSLLMRGRMALLFASIASFAVISEQFVDFLFVKAITPGLVQAAFLGIAFFAIALLSHSLGLHIARSERKAAEALKAFDNMAQINQSIIQQLTTGVVTVDKQNHILSINDQAKNYFANEQFESVTTLDQLAPQLAIITDQFRDSGEAQGSRLLSYHQNNFAITFNRSASDNSPVILVFIEDQAQIRNQANQLKLASLGRLTASIAHEIRNPLSAINYAAQLLEEDELNDPKTIQRLVTIINGNTDRLNQIIENILQLSRRAKPELTDVEIEPFLEQIKSQAIAEQQLHQHQISIQVASPIMLPIDRRQIEQAMLSMIANAVSHFSAALNTLQIELNAQIDKGKITLQIIDNGTGIKPEHSQQIFEPFFTTRHEGTGLGLYIARDIIEANGGQLRYTNRDPHGSIFSLIFNTNTPDKP